MLVMAVTKCVAVASLHSQTGTLCDTLALCNGVQQWVKINSNKSMNSMSRKYFKTERQNKTSLLF